MDGKIDGVRMPYERYRGLYLRDDGGFEQVGHLQVGMLVRGLSWLCPAVEWVWRDLLGVVLD